MEKEGKLIILFSFILLAFLILFGFTQFFEGHPIRQFCVVITTDSMGTKSTLYTWHRFNKTMDNMPIEVYEVLDLDQNDSGYDVLLAASENQLDIYFKMILKSASSEIQMGIKSFTPIYFNFLLENGENKETFGALTNKINIKLKNSGFFFDNTHVNFIDGKQKASYLWLITNYLLRFNDINFYNLNNTVAVHHISNDSVTIAYATNDTRNKDSLVEREIFGQNYTLYAQTFDKLGFVLSFDNMLNNISTQNKYTGCLPLNYKVVTPQYTIFGMSDFPSCQTAVHKLLNMSDACYNSNNCTINGQYIPLPVSPLFYATNDHVIEFLGLNNNIQTHTSAPLTNYTTLLSNVTKMCDLSLDQYKSTYNADPLNYCFDGTLMLSLYNYAFRLSDKTSIVWSREINEMPITWEGGFFLEVGSAYYPWGNFVLVNMGDNFRISFLVISLIISVFSAGFLIFLVIRLVKKKKMYNNYENITVL